MIPCACGCGQTFPPTDRYGRPRRFVRGHNERVKGLERKPAPARTPRPLPSFPPAVIQRALQLRKRGYVPYEIHHHLLDEGHDVPARVIFAWQKAA